MKRATATLDQLKRSACAKLNPHLFEKPRQKEKRSKYGAKKTEVEGIVFDSKKEAGRYLELKILLKAGVIGQLELQVPFELNEGGSHSLKYIADFVYIDTNTGEKVVEDVKGYRTKEYKKKKKLMNKIYNLTILEV